MSINEFDPSQRSFATELKTPIRSIDRRVGGLVLEQSALIVKELAGSYHDKKAGHKVRIFSPGASGIRYSTIDIVSARDVKLTPELFRAYDPEEMAELLGNEVKSLRRSIDEVELSYVDVWSPRDATGRTMIDLSPRNDIKDQLNSERIETYKSLFRLANLPFTEPSTDRHFGQVRLAELPRTVPVRIVNEIADRIDDMHLPSVVSLAPAID